MMEDDDEAKQVERETDGDLDFAHLAQTSPIDASDCVGREECLAEVRRMRKLLLEYSEAAAKRDCGKVRLVLRGGEEAYGDALHYHPRMYLARGKDISFDRLFDLEGGAVSVEVVDDEYGLSDDMPGCSIELIASEPPPQSTAGLELMTCTVAFIEKTVRWNFDEGEWRGLYTYDANEREPKKYWIVVFQDPKEREADMAKSRQRLEESADPTEPDPTEPIKKRMEGCSCLYGNPCTEFNKYNCKDWENRFAVARANS